MQPLLYAALALALGIGARAVLTMPWTGAGWMAALALLAAAAALSWLRRRRAAALLALLFCVAAGYARLAWHIEHPAPLPAWVTLLPTWQPHPRDRVWLSGRLRDDPEVLMAGGRATALRLDLELAAAGVAPEQAVWPASGGVRLYSYAPNGAAVFGDPDDAEAAAPPATTAWPGALSRLHAGDGIAVRVHLRRIEGFHDPGVADTTATERRQGINYTATLAAGAWNPWPTAGGGTLAVRARLWRWLSRQVDVLAPPARDAPLNAVLRGMLLGDVERLDAATRTSFQVDGVYHLVVVAGLHIGILAGFLLWGLRRLRLGRLPAAAVSLALLAAYAWVIAGRTPTLRALLMLAVYLAARWWYRERQALNAVGAAALVLLVWHPEDLFAAGWQMSLGAALVLAGLALPLLARSTRPLVAATRRLADTGVDLSLPPRLAQWRVQLRDLAAHLGEIWHPLGWRVLPWGVRIVLEAAEVVAVSALLQIGFAAYNAIYFHRANPWSVVANAVLVPAAGLLIPLAWVALGLQGLGLGVGLSGAIRWMGDSLLHRATQMAAWPGAAVRVPSPPPSVLLAFAALMGVWIWQWNRPTRIGRWMGWLPALAATVAAVLIAWAPFPPRLPPGLSATVLDVGQGDSIFVAFPDGRTLVVDGGPRSAHWDSGGQIVEPFLWSLGLHRVDAVLLTHAHNDHLGGLGAVVRDFHPSEVWVTATLPTEPAVATFLREVKASGARLRPTVAGDIFLAGSTRLQVLLPPSSYHAGEVASNDDSLALRLSNGPNSMLLTGDTEAAGEAWMLAHNEPLRSALLKVGHHGSRTSTTPAFVAAVQPRVAVISVGRDNVYGHPSPEVVARLEQSGARVYRTDHDGAVECRLTPAQLEIFLFRRWPGD